jgi:hypothetical protein
MRDGIEPLDTKQTCFLEALLQVPTVLAAAKQANISEATAHRWLKQERFRAALREARRETFAQATARLAAAAVDAVDALSGVATDNTAEAEVRVKAAQVILNTALKAAETDDVIARLDALQTIRSESDVLELQAKILEERAAAGR